jgi:hypothetical protein
MPNLLARRIQGAGDTIARFESAALRRFAEADLLRADHDRHLAAIYLYGYCVELWLKAAVYRSFGFSSRQRITISDRRSAEAQVSPFAKTQGTPGHSLTAWVGYLAARKAPGNPALSIEIDRRATELSLRWRETFRYAPNRPSNQEIIDVHEVATWFRRKHRRALR